MIERSGAEGSVMEERTMAGWMPQGSVASSVIPQGSISSPRTLPVSSSFAPQGSVASSFPQGSVASSARPFDRVMQVPAMTQPVRPNPIAGPPISLVPSNGIFMSPDILHPMQWSVQSPRSASPDGKPQAIADAEAELGGMVGRSPTFVVPSDKQRTILDDFQKREQHIEEKIDKQKPLCFNGSTYQRTHPRKVALGHKDADAALVSPMLLGVADGVSQIEDYGIDPSQLPKDLMKMCEELAMAKLLPSRAAAAMEQYYGPISLLTEAYECTESMGSTTILLAILDNSTRIHGKLHPMIAMISVGDCEIIVLRRTKDDHRLQMIFNTEMQRIDGHTQTPLQIARVDDEIDPVFDESIALEVIQEGSAVHCISAYEGDILVMGSDGVFDNMFPEEIVGICDDMLPPRQPGIPFAPTDPAHLRQVAKRIVQQSHAKTVPDAHGHYLASPIGVGGKVDDTCCVVGEVIEWTEQHHEAWNEVVKHRKWNNFVTCGGHCKSNKDIAVKVPEPESMCSVS